MPGKPWPHALYTRPRKGFCIWQWQKGKWSVIREHAHPGYMHGDPPVKRGKYEGEIRLQVCVKKPKRMPKKK
jgi:hypothetical protein